MRREGVEHHVHAGGIERRAHLLGGEHAGNRRIAAAEALAGHQHVRRHAPVVEAEGRAGASEASHHVVRQQQHVVAVAELARALPVAVGRHQRAPACADDGFRQQRSDGIRADAQNLRFQRIEAVAHDVRIAPWLAQGIGRRHPGISRKRLFEAALAGFVAARGSRRQRRAVVGRRTGDDRRLARLAARGVVLNGNLHGGFDAFGAAAREVVAGQVRRQPVPGEAFEQPFALRREPRRHDVGTRQRGLVDGIRHFLAPVADVDHHGAAGGIEYPRAVGVVEMGALPLDHGVQGARGRGEGPVDGHGDIDAARCQQV